MLDKIVEALKHAAVVERPPIMEARIISMILSKAPGWEPQKAASGAHPRKGEKPGTTPEATEPEASPEAATDAPQADATIAEQTPSTPS